MEADLLAQRRQGSRIGLSKVHEYPVLGSGQRASEIAVNQGG
jgi:hypothetical protein